MHKKKIGDAEYNKIYAALKLVENLFKQNVIQQHIFKNILNDYKDILDISEFEYYN